MNLKLLQPQNYDLELNFLTKVVGLESLHHGYWLPGEELTLKNLKQAQARYTNKILKWIPNNTKTILDVGAGIGDNALALAELGYQVTSLSPEPSQEQIFKKIIKKQPKISFVATKYEDFITDKKFDLILMSESSNYIQLEVGMDKNQSLLTKGGHLLVIGIFSKAENLKGRRDNEHRYSRTDFLKESSRAGLKLVKQEDITAATLPTMTLAFEYYNQFIKPSVQVAGEYYTRAFSLKAKLLTLLFRKEIKFIREMITETVPERIDPIAFDRDYTYEILLFQKR